MGMHGSMAHDSTRLKKLAAKCEAVLVSADQNIDGTKIWFVEDHTCTWQLLQYICMKL